MTVTEEMTLRRALISTQEEANDYALLHWPDEGCVSIVALSDIIGTPLENEYCQVHVGKKNYNGMIIKIGTFVIKFNTLNIKLYYITL